MDEGGETCFPLAETDFDKWDEHTGDASIVPTGWNMITNSSADRWNLTYRANCHRSGVYVTPKKGLALLFYNHLGAHCFEGQQWGCELGEMDRYSMHGACDVIRGVKWSANNWINVRDDKWNPQRITEKKRKRAEEPLKETIVLPHAIDSLPHMEL